MADKPSVLFVCVHNAGRSQMASALLRQGPHRSPLCGNRTRGPDQPGRHRSHGRTRYRHHHCNPHNTEQ